MTDLVPEVTVVVHPYAGEWRWGVNVGGRPLADLDHCVASLMHTDKREAEIIGQQAGVAAVKALRMFGVPARSAYLDLDYDPLPADADQQPVGMWKGGSD